MRLKLISCEIFHRELCGAVSRSINQVDLEFLPKGLHDMKSAEMIRRIQDGLDRVDASRYDGVVFGYALCNNGLVGLTARQLPIVIPRAHDCITLFLGSRGRYLEYFNAHPGVYFKTTGWMERGSAPDGELGQFSVQHQIGMDQSYEDLVAKYGEDNARFLWETLCQQVRNYKQFTFIEMGVEPDDRFERQARREAAEKGWAFEKLRGDPRLLQRLVDGPWNPEEFLTLQPGQSLAASYDEGIIACQNCPLPVKMSRPPETL